LEFGLFTQAFNPPKARQSDPDSEHSRIMYEVELVQAADRAGFKYVWAAEHHFLDEYSHLSASESWLGFVAAKTSRIHIGSGIFNVTPPVNHPARIAERVAMLDHLSEGRFEFGTGRGSSTTEQKGFGIPDPELTREMWDEVVPQLAQMWSSTSYSYQGKWFSMPERNVLPKPWVRPHPPMWVACGSPGTFEKAARLGLGALGFTTGHPASLAPLVKAYKDNISKAEPVGDYVNDNVTLVSSMMCLEDGQAARRHMCDMGLGYLQSLVFRYLDTFPRPPGIPEWPELVPDPSMDTIDSLIDMGAVICGTPDECAKGVQAYADIGADQLVFGCLLAPLEVAVESVETFGREVIPRFDHDPEHRTSRMRRAACA
jgi:alkanesulfonate monooxygenase SsuD/methylene tetrahydromethanopterin reductase-like flavin-dependent oxidoreductase (luciferase family)